MFKIDIIGGARPNFIKIAGIIHAIRKLNHPQISYRFIHTGQHTDKVLSDELMESLEIGYPDVLLNGSGDTTSSLTGSIMTAYESVIRESRPDLCLVVGDVTSTMAVAIVAKKEGIPLAHIEAGLRSGDRSMPEEINRIVTDSISDYFFTTTPSASVQLTREGHNAQHIFLVGNTMIDSLKRYRHFWTAPEIYHRVQNQKFIVLTLHRPSNVDNPEKLGKLLYQITETLKDVKVIFPVHPRTAKNIVSLQVDFPNILTTGPLPYFEFMFLISNCCGIITDSGGITEEATVLGIPCITVRENTERPETVSLGTNILVGNDFDRVKEYMEKMLAGDWKKGEIPQLWDGQASERIVQVIQEIAHLK